MEVQGRRDQRRASNLTRQQRADVVLPAYRRAIKLRGENLSFRAIVDRLNAEGIKTPRGGSWHASTVRAMLTSETAKSL